MKIKELNRKNKCYQGDIYKRYNALYEGGKTFKDNIEMFLSKNSFEDAEVYNARKRDACYEPYCNTLVNQFASQLFSSPFDIKAKVEGQDQQDLAPVYNKFKENCDLNGKDLVTFTHGLFTSALVKGAAWIVAKRPNLDGIDVEKTSNDEFQSLNLDNFWISQLEAEEVYDWECDDEFDNLIWVITHNKKERRTSIHDDRNFVTETWTVYDDTSIETFQIIYKVSEKPGEDTIVPSLGKVAHNFSRIPVLCLDIPVGLWLMNRLASAAQEHFSMDNALGWVMRRSCYPVWVFKSEGKNVQKNPDGFGIMIGIEESFSSISPDPAPFEAIAKRVSDKKDEMHRLSLQMALAIDNTSSAVRRSGESKTQDTKSTEIILYSYADIVKSFIEKLFELISDARGDESLIFSIEGMDKFVIDDSAATMNAATQAKLLGIPSETFNKELYCKVVNVLLPQLDQNAKNKIRNEIMSAKPEDFKPEPKMETDPLKKEDQKNQNSKEKP